MIWNGELDFQNPDWQEVKDNCRSYPIETKKGPQQLGTMKKGELAKYKTKLLDTITKVFKEYPKGAATGSPINKRMFNYYHELCHIEAAIQTFGLLDPRFEYFATDKRTEVRIQLAPVSGKPDLCVIYSSGENRIPIFDGKMLTHEEFAELILKQKHDRAPLALEFALVSKLDHGLISGSPQVELKSTKLSVVG